jgi:predicted Zn-dependent protease
MGRIRELGVALALAALAAGYQTTATTQPGVVGVERRQSMLISSEKINRAAEQAYRDTLAEAEKKKQLNRDPALLARVRGISRRLIPKTAAFRADAPGWKWETNVISAKDVNAWCMPGGKIVVYSGLVERLNPTDDELAAVMGHEIAHALREHGRERASQIMAQQIILDVVTAVAGLPDDTKRLSETVLDVTLNLPNSRTHETEADRVGVELAARAGYDPRAAVSLWRKMEQLGGGQPPEFLSTHPSHESRIEDLQVYAERVMPLYQAARAAR